MSLPLSKYRLLSCVGGFYSHGCFILLRHRGHSVSSKFSPWPCEEGLDIDLTLAAAAALGVALVKEEANRCENPCFQSRLLVYVEAHASLCDLI